MENTTINYAKSYVDITSHFLLLYFFEEYVSFALENISLVELYCSGPTP